MKPCHHPLCPDSGPCRKLKPKAKPKPIPKVSKKRAKVNTVYQQKARAFKKLHPFCQARLTGCQTLTSSVHHKRGRGKYLLDETTWLATYFSCHRVIEDNPDEAKRRGFSESRLKEYDLHSSYPNSEI